ncbi:hypothetical protein B0H13DRAFT_2283963 [Mycena leptocephala]|nr:hypothetical protein B0H13DRAFT_2283963 [Mycena leptocephala]
MIWAVFLPWSDIACLAESLQTLFATQLLLIRINGRPNYLKNPYAFAPNQPLTGVRHAKPHGPWSGVRAVLSNDIDGVDGWSRKASGKGYADCRRHAKVGHFHWRKLEQGERNRLVEGQGSTLPGPGDFKLKAYRVYSIHRMQGNHNLNEPMEFRIEASESWFLFCQNGTTHVIVIQTPPRSHTSFLPSCKPFFLCFFVIATLSGTQVFSVTVRRPSDANAPSARTLTLAACCSVSRQEHWIPSVWAVLASCSGGRSAALRVCASLELPTPPLASQLHSARWAMSPKDQGGCKEVVGDCEYPRAARYTSRTVDSEAELAGWAHGAYATGEDLALCTWARAPPRRRKRRLCTVGSLYSDTRFFAGASPRSVASLLSFASVSEFVYSFALGRGRGGDGDERSGKWEAQKGDTELSRICVPRSQWRLYSSWTRTPVTISSVFLDADAYGLPARPSPRLGEDEVLGTWRSVSRPEIWDGQERVSPGRNREAVGEARCAPRPADLPPNLPASPYPAADVVAGVGGVVGLTECTIRMREDGRYPGFSFIRARPAVLLVPDAASLLSLLACGAGLAVDERLLFPWLSRGCAGSVPSTFYNPRASACPAWRPYFRVRTSVSRKAGAELEIETSRDCACPCPREGNYGGARSRNDAHALGKTYYARLRDAHLHPHLGVYPSALSPLPLMTPHLHLCKVHSSIRVLASLGTPPSALPLITGCSARTASLMPIRTKSHAISLVLPSPLCVSAGRARYGG